MKKWYEDLNRKEGTKKEVGVVRMFHHLLTGMYNNSLIQYSHNPTVSIAYNCLSAAMVWYGKVWSTYNL